MSSFNIKKQLKQKRQRSFLTKDFDSFRSELLKYAGLYFGDKIKDFTYGSVGGMFLDFVSHVGDVTSYYLDHQLGETNLETAVETKNLERLIRLAGVKSFGASPSFVEVNFTFKIDAERTSFGYVPIRSNLPVIKTGTKVESKTGIVFELLDDLDFSETDLDGKLLSTYSTYSTDTAGSPTVFLVTRSGLCSSGTTTSENFTFGSSTNAFKSISLSRNNVNELIRVVDSDLNEYFEVETLSHDVVYKRITNLGDDRDSVGDSLVVVPAPYRFITRQESGGSMTLVFGSGQADTLDDDILPDPSEVSIPLFGDRKSFSNTALDPNSLLGSRSLGITPTNTAITVRYRSGGGLDNNVGSNTIKKVLSLITTFSSGVSSSKISSIRSSINTDNTGEALGGEDAPTIEDLRSIALNFRNSQNRIVSKEDLIARTLTMPTNFGRVFRIGIQPNVVNPLSTLCFVVNRNSDGFLTTTPDIIKRNIATYINQFRLISDSIDILDAQIINIKLIYDVVLDSRVDKTSTLIVINTAIKNYFNIKNFQIDQPIIVSDIINLIMNQDGVISLSNYSFASINGTIENNVYSNTFFNVNASISRGIIKPSTGGIFELKYPDIDIVANAV